MADSFGDRVAAATAATGPLCAGIDPSSALLQAWGLAGRCQGIARLLRDVRRGVRRRGQRGQATGGLLRAARRGRDGGAGTADRRRHGCRPDRDRRRQARGHRLDRRRLCRRLVGRGQLAGGGRGHGPPLPGPRCVGAPGPARARPPDVASLSWPGARIPRAGTCNRPSPPGDPPWRTCSWPRSPSSTARQRCRAERSVRSSGRRWSRRISRYPSSEGLFWLPGWEPRAPAPPMWRPVLPDVGPARCSRAAPAGS